MEEGDFGGVGGGLEGESESRLGGWGEEGGDMALGVGGLVVEGTGFGRN